MPLDNITVKQAIWSGKPSGDKLTDEKGMFLLVNKSGKFGNSSIVMREKRRSSP
ncbi:hypothetical protein [Aeromonas veronii]|uniref:hypothetical protein n=1 Tax=Aeromonas veronii TaxID=654 RepID=UPI001F34D8E1|nr:hypothetical protein [Aeromonas veronii]